MVMYCCVPGCNATGKSSMLHRLPNDIGLRKIWCQAIDRLSLWDINDKKRSNHRVCDSHFSEEYKVEMCRSRTNLKRNAIPTLNVPGSLPSEADLQAMLKTPRLNVTSDSQSRPAPLEDVHSPDWIPTQNMGYPPFQKTDQGWQPVHQGPVTPLIVTRGTQLSEKGKLEVPKPTTSAIQLKTKQGGRPAQLDDVDSPDWVPTQNMGYPTPVTQGKQSTMGKLHIPTPPVQVKTEQKENVSSVQLAAEKSAVLLKESGLKKHPLKSPENDRPDSIKLNDRMCRLCLEEEPDMWLFCSIITFEDQSTLDMVQVFQNLTEESTEQIENPMLPKHICKACVDLLVNAHSFHQTYEKSNKIILEFLSTQKNENKSTETCSKPCLDEAKVDYVECKLEPEEENEDALLQHPDETNADALLQYPDETNADSDDELLPKAENSNPSPEESSEEEAKPTRKLHRCPICLKKFTALDLKQHCRTHRDLKKYLNAAPRFNKKVKFYANPRTNNTCLFYKENILHPCPFCSEEFEAHKFEEHMKLHRTEGNFRCNICNRIFLGMNHLKMHQLYHRQEATFKCQDCGKGFFQQKNFEFHRLTHTTTSDDYPFKCQHCKRAFSNPEHLKRHSFIHEKSVSYQKYYQLLTTHVNCKKCLQKFKTLEELNEHVCRFCCAKCHKIFGKKNEFSAHVCKFKLKPSQCRPCKKVFQLPSSASMHKSRCTYRTLCYVCGKNVSNITLHLLTHYPQKKRIYTCAHCGKQFRDSSSLNRHITVVHLKIEAFKCQYCGRGFKSKSNMQVHERIHVGVRNHVCLVCGKGFLEKSYLRKHSKVHARVDLMAEKLKDKYIDDFWSQ